MSDVLDGYTKQEDIEYLYTLACCGLCEDCGELDTGYCWCTSCLESEIEATGEDGERLLAEHRMQVAGFESEARMRIVKRLTIKNMRKWKKCVTAMCFSNYLFELCSRVARHVISTSVIPATPVHQDW